MTTRKYVLMAQRQDNTGTPVCIYVTVRKTRAQADAKRRETKRTRYWVLPYERAFPNAQSKEL
jgi:hypothetical protein